MIKIIIVEDHLIFSEALKNLIKGFDDDIQVTEQFYNGQEVVDYCAQCKEFPDIILMDIQMPILNGIEATQWIYNVYPNIKIIALTMHDSKETTLKMLHAGAKSYLLKTIEPEELHKAIVETYQKGFYYTKHILELGLHINN
jgi:DNA-binding NarL/FixJ family response regulator